MILLQKKNMEKYYLDKLIKFNSKVDYGTASKESLKFFEKLIDKISHLNLHYFIGVENNSEYFIYDSINSRLNFYDFCIKKLNIIIEFHGSIWHYNPNYSYNKELPFGITTKENKAKDIYKKALAEFHNFEYYVVFDTDNYDELSDKLSSIIETKLNQI